MSHQEVVADVNQPQKMASPGYQVVREESLSCVHDEIVNVFQATRSGPVVERRFDWLYDQNPDGRAALWTLRKSDTGEIVGFTACLPRRMWIGGQCKLAWIGSDFSVLPRYRTLGLAIKLRRAAREAIDAGEADFLYAHPNDRMALIHQRAGHSPAGFMHRYACVLRTAPYLQERLRAPLLAELGGPILDGAWSIARTFTAPRRQFRIQETGSREFDDRFDRLFESHATGNAILGVRDARYLNWRYGANPLYSSRVLTAWNGDDLAGYLVFTNEDNSLVIKDVFPATEPVVVRDLLSAAAACGRQLKCQSATFTLLQGHPLLSELRTAGYRLRPEQSQMFVYHPLQSSDESGILASAQWLITVGDRDV